ncbi:MAG: hypothetical protein HGA96_07210 [Desulfobulbaceae bacterium]|nr:hypothetical protein [Desulfobulbaceae bacterium]
MKLPLFIPTLFAATLGLTTAALAAPEAKIPMAKLCGGCHKPEPGVMMGFLDGIAMKSKTIQMDFMDHKEVVKFTDATSVKYVKSLDDLKNYRTKGFQINFVEKDGAKIATEVIRFDILRALSDDEKLDKAAFLKYRETPNLKLYDVRPLEAYKSAHIPSAQPLPAPAFDKFVKNLPADKDTPIVLYCTGGCLSPTAAMKTKALGYKNVKIYTGGYPEWSQGESGVVEADWLKETLAAGNPQVIIDLRPAAEVRAGHLPGAVALAAAELDQAKERFPARKNAPLIFFGPGSNEAAAKAVAWGYKMVRVLPLSIAEWQAGGGPVVTGPTATAMVYVPKPKPGTIGVAEFQQLAAKPAAKIQLVDVRNPDELEEGTIPGTLNLPVDDIVQSSKEIPADRELVLYCNTGIRAEMAHNLLAESGRANRYLDGKVAFDDGKLEVTEN